MLSKNEIDLKVDYVLLIYNEKFDGHKYIIVSNMISS